MTELAQQRRRRREKVSGVVLLAVAVCFAVPYLITRSHQSATHTVTYTVTGTVASTITEITPDGEQQVSDAPLPWIDVFTAKTGEPLVVSAQNAGAGTVGCSIAVDGAEVKTAQSVGQSAVVTCSGTIG